jgi:aryl-alcohol dehydrogenase-like predicted oxidoreductase
MEYTRLGTTGMKVSRIALGMMTYGAKSWREWVLEWDESEPILRRAFEAGINFFDTADIYSLGASEEITGRAVKEFAARREDVVIATKVYNAMSDGVNDKGLSRKHIMDSIDKSLKRLGTEYVDLYQIHRFDAETPIEETVEALNDVVRAGKALYVGASSMYAWQFLKMLQTQEKHGYAKFVTMQNHYNLVYREEEREMNPLCIAEGVGLIPWSPLARGFLAGNRKQNEDKAAGETARARTDAFAHKLYYREDDFTVVDRLSEVAEARGAKNAQVALAWMLAKPGISAPIIGASKMYQLEDALAAMEIKLEASEVKWLEEPYEPHPVLGITM